MEKFIQTLLVIIVASIAVLLISPIIAVKDTAVNGESVLVAQPGQICLSDCGDGLCSAGENCSNCTDCGICTNSSDGVCTIGENCSNSSDCGTCADIDNQDQNQDSD